jgi:hypothetical protein
VARVLIIAILVFLAFASCVLAVLRLNLQKERAFRGADNRGTRPYFTAPE